MTHKLSKEIEYDRVSKETFTELLDTMKARDVKTVTGGEYIDEGRDGFLDLYKYWNDLGKYANKRIREKIKTNNAYLKSK